MIKHIILWKIDDKFSAEQKASIAEGAKTALCALVGKVPGLIEVKVQTEKLNSSNADLMLDSTLKSIEALQSYQTHPDHVAAADNFVRPFMSQRLCLDFEV